MGGAFFEIWYRGLASRFNIVAVWTKRIDISRKYVSYEENNISAINSPTYSEEFCKKTIIIGDYTTGNKTDYLKMDKEFEGFINCATLSDMEYKPTYYHSDGNYYTNDFCYVSKDMPDAFDIKMEILSPVILHLNELG
jgi:hypothetical protein